jgi:hypothetical protein
VHENGSLHTGYCSFQTGEPGLKGIKSFIHDSMDDERLVEDVREDGGRHLINICLGRWMELHKSDESFVATICKE